MVGKKEHFRSDFENGKGEQRNIWVREWRFEKNFRQMKVILVGREGIDR
jgi:hypothetical protein